METPERASVRFAILAEDDPDERDLAAWVLASRGFVVATCGTIEEAVAAARARRPDLLVTDLALGRESGVDLARRVRALPGCEEVAIVATSGRVDPDWQVVRHFDVYIRKPVDPEMLGAVAVQMSSSARGVSARAGLAKVHPLRPRAKRP